MFGKPFPTEYVRRCQTNFLQIILSLLHFTSAGPIISSNQRPQALAIVPVRQYGFTTGSLGFLVFFAKDARLMFVFAFPFPLVTTSSIYFVFAVTTVCKTIGTPTGNNARPLPRWYCTVVCTPQKQKQSPRTLKGPRHQCMFVIKPVITGSTRGPFQSSCLQHGQLATLRTSSQLFPTVWFRWTNIIFVISLWLHLHSCQDV